MRRLAETATGVVLSAVMVGLGEGLHPVWLLAWLAPVPLVLLALRRGAGHAGVAAVVACSVGRLPFGAFLARELEVPLPVVAAIVVLPAMVVAASVLLARALVLRRAPWSGVLAFPATWVAAEFLFSTGPDGTAGVRAYSQMDCLPVLQLASLTGVWGISFVLALAAAGLAVGLHLRDRAVLGVTLTVVATVFAFGEWRVTRVAARDDRTIRVGQAATEETRAGVSQVISGDPAGAPAIVEAYAAEVDALARQGARIVVLPEEIVGATAVDEAAVRERLSEAAARNHVTLVAGVRLVAKPRGRNVAMVFASTGALEGTYVKEHLVPGFEVPRLEPGSDLLLLEEPVFAGVAICKDMDFADPARRYADEGVGLLLVPAWDFRDDGWVHGRMAIARAVELGLPLVRSAQGGMLTATDAFGRVLAESVTGPAPARQIAEVPVRQHPTFYRRYGDWFAHATLGLLAAVVVRLVGLVARARRSQR
jgi:apolipoprotein N-acyltransferase